MLALRLRLYFKGTITWTIYFTLLYFTLTLTHFDAQGWKHLADTILLSHLRVTGVAQEILTLTLANNAQTALDVCVRTKNISCVFWYLSPGRPYDLGSADPKLGSLAARVTHRPVGDNTDLSYLFGILSYFFKRYRTLIIKKIINVLMLFVLLEFVNLVRSHELGALQPKVHFLLRSAASTVVPRTQRPQFIAAHLQNTQETYSCCPPPLLMPIHGWIRRQKMVVFCSV